MNGDSTRKFRFSPKKIRRESTLFRILESRLHFFSRFGIHRALRHDGECILRHYEPIAMNGLALEPVALEPNVELLRIEGWQVISVSGPYCTAWRGGLEVVLMWKDGAWQRLNG